MRHVLAAGVMVIALTQASGQEAKKDETGVCVQTKDAVGVLSCQSESLAAVGGSDWKGEYAEEKVICSETAFTPELHNVVFYSGGKCRKVGDGKWCFEPTSLSVRTPNSRWVFSSGAWLRCAQDNRGSCGWNSIGRHDRFSISLDNPTLIRATAWTNSRSIGLQLCARARFYP